ncbi:hypothetical protein HHI36_001478 [Cryptolaemus montrouzieri]|uniref:RNase H type-1 domain-containing protein n=1 Tax=Cryptolaemus montrouzieri TaxID=559131 RepID=A0ABD2P8H5_9CUCU
MENIQIKFMWIPSHTNIEYNEKADQLAKQGQDEEIYGTYKFNPREIWPKIKTDLWKEWKGEWDRITLTKGKYYANLQQSTKINEKPWYKNFNNLSRKHITTMNGL